MIQVRLVLAPVEPVVLVKVAQLLQRVERLVLAGLPAWVGLARVALLESVELVAQSHRQEEAESEVQVGPRPQLASEVQAAASDLDCQS